MSSNIIFSRQVSAYQNILIYIMDDKIVMFRSIIEDQTLNDKQIIKFINWGKGDIQQALNYYFKNLQKGKIKRNSQSQFGLNNSKVQVQNKKEGKSVEKQKVQAVSVENHKRLSQLSVQSEQQSIGNSRDAFQVLKKGSQQHKKTHDFIKRVRQIYKLPIRGKPQKQLIKNSKSCLPENEGQIPEQFLMVDCLTQAFNSDYITQLSQKKMKQFQQQRVSQQKNDNNKVGYRVSGEMAGNNNLNQSSNKYANQHKNNIKQDSTFANNGKKMENKKCVQISISQSEGSKEEEDSFKDIEEYQYKHVFSNSKPVKQQKEKKQIVIEEASVDQQRYEGQQNKQQKPRRGRKKGSKKESKSQYKPEKQSQQKFQPTLPKMLQKDNNQIKTSTQIAQSRTKNTLHSSQSQSVSDCQSLILLQQNQFLLGEYFVKGFCTEKHCYQRQCIGDHVQIVSYIQDLKTKKNKKFGKNAQRTMNMRINYRGRPVGRINHDEVRIILPLIDQSLIRVQFLLHQIPLLSDLYKPLTLKAKVFVLKKLITQPVVQNFQPHENDKDRVHQLSGLLEKLSLPILTEPLIKSKSKYIKAQKKQKKKYQSIDIMQYNNENEQYEKQLKHRQEMEEKNKNEIYRMRNDPYFKQRQQSLKDMIVKKQETYMAKNQNSQENVDFDENVVKKKVIEIDTQAQKDKLSELIQLHEDNCQAFYPSHNFNSELYPYQALALGWMLKRQGFLNNNQDKQELHPLWTQYKVPSSKKYEHLYFNQLTGQLCIKRPTALIKCKGGILADEMGLGKTVMMTALIVSNPPNQGYLSSENACTLVIVPLTLLSQWQSEIAKHTKNQKVAIYYSNDRKKIANNLHKYDVVLSTYGTVSHEYAQGCHTKKTGIYKYKWHRVILDEAHYIKGRIIQTSKATYEISGLYRWCLTGTPIQNCATDIFSLLHFIKYTPWSQFACWNRFIVKPLEEEDESIYNVLRTILKQVFLRRTKNSKGSNGKAIIELPPRTSKVQLLTLSDKEREFYDSIYAASRTDFDALIDKGILQAKYMQVLEMLMRLRQICCHPILFKSVTKFTKTTQQFEKQLKKLIQRSSRKKSALQTNSQSEDEYYEPIIDGDNQEMRIKSTNNEINEQYFHEVLQKIANDNLDNCIICLDQPQDPVINCCLHIFCKSCNIRQIEEKGFCSFCRRPLLKDDFIHLPRQNRLNIKKDQQKDCQSVFLSTKMIALNEHLVTLKEEDKVVIFSQFLGMLDLLEDELKRNGFKYVRMQGSNTHKQRTKIVKAFQQDPSVKIFLVSLKTAGVGLNLVAANKVFLMDPWWNPAVEQQAIERVHRIGQKRDVEIVRFIIDKSIETRMLELNTEKKNLSQNILNVNTDQDGTTKQKIEKLKYLMENY